MNCMWKPKALDQLFLYTNLGNFAALLKLKSNWFWVGFYEVVGQQLILNAFQGPPACVKFLMERSMWKIMGTKDFYYSG